MLGQQTNACSEPRCVASLLDRLDGAAAGLRAGRALGPYMLEALLDDVALCPAMAHREGLAEDRHDALASAISEARRAVAARGFNLFQQRPMAAELSPLIEDWSASAPARAVSELRFR